MYDFWYWVADWCQENNIPLLLAHAKMLKAISYAKVKTDKVDARTLAELLRAGLIPEAHMQLGAQCDLRELTRGRLRMVHRREKIQSSLWNLATKYNVNIHDVESAWRYPDQLSRWLEAQLPPVSYLEAKLLLEQLIQLQSHIVQIEQSIEELSEFSPELERLMAVPGVGLVTGWTILAEVGDILRFTSDKKFVIAVWFLAVKTVPATAATNPAIRMATNICVWLLDRQRSVPIAIMDRSNDFITK